MNNLDQMTIDGYFAEFSHFHVEKATELLKPLHTPGQDPLPDFSCATRQPFEPQAHAIAAAVKMLDETRRGMIVSECGRRCSVPDLVCRTGPRISAELLGRIRDRPSRRLHRIAAGNPGVAQLGRPRGLWPEEHRFRATELRKR